MTLYKCRAQVVACRSGTLVSGGKGIGATYKSYVCCISRGGGADREPRPGAENGRTTRTQGAGRGGPNPATTTSDGGERRRRKDGGRNEATARQTRTPTGGKEAQARQRRRRERRRERRRQKQQASASAGGREESGTWRLGVKVEQCQNGGGSRG